MSRWEAELDDLVSQRGPALVRYAYMVCGDRRDAEDLVQEALVKVFSRLRRPHRSEGTAAHPLDTRPDDPDRTLANPEGYVRRTILRLHIDGYRHRALWTERRHLVAAEDHRPGPASGVSVRADVATALASLTPQRRACVVLRFYEDLTVPQIATALGVAEGTVKRYLSEATSRLRAVLRPRTQPMPQQSATIDGGTR